MVVVRGGALSAALDALRMKESKAARAYGEGSRSRRLGGEINRRSNNGMQRTRRKRLSHQR